MSIEGLQVQYDLVNMTFNKHVRWYMCMMEKFLLHCSTTTRLNVNIDLLLDLLVSGMYCFDNLPSFNHKVIPYQYFRLCFFVG